MAKSLLAKARDKWVASDTGKECCEGYPSGQHLRHRLERAFIDGWIAGEKSILKGK